MRRTKIIGTIGPSSSSKGVLKEMVRAGLSTVRVNTAHVSEGDIERTKELVDSINRDSGTHTGVMVDLKGPELRTGTFAGGVYDISKGKKYKLSYDHQGCDICLNSPNVYSMIRENDIVLMSDGLVKLRVVELDEDWAVVTALNSGTIRDRSRVNIPGRLLELGTVTQRDVNFIEEGVRSGVAFFALSFVQSKKNVEELQKIVLDKGGNQEIVSKIETKNGLLNVREIARSSGFVMVARGDLGVELPLREVSMAQKKIIRECHSEGVPTIVATQILESMVNNNSPTRAEVSDITNAILDNTDALMLSEETAIGRYPVEAVRYLSQISEYVEPRINRASEPESFYGNRVAFSISMASKVVSSEINSDGILVFTKSGNTAKMVSAMRPDVPIYAAVTEESVARRLNLLRGVTPILLPPKFSKSNDLLGAVEYISSRGKFSKKSRFVVTSGAPYFLFGGTNDVRIVTMGKFYGRGYPAGKTIEGRITKRIEGDGEILLSDSIELNLPDILGKFQGIIFVKEIPLEFKERLVSSGLTVLTNASLVSEPEEGQLVTIDGETGVITY